MPCYNLENVGDFAVTANVAHSTIYMPAPPPAQPFHIQSDAPSQSSCVHPAQLDGVTYHRYVNVRGPIVAGDVNQSIIGGTQHASIPPTSSEAALTIGSGNGSSEHYHFQNCSSWLTIGRIDSSVIVHRNADQEKSEEMASREASGGPSSGLDAPGSYNQKFEPQGSGGSMRGAPQGPVISTRRGRGPADIAESLSLASRLKRAERHALAALKRHKLQASLQPPRKAPTTRPAFTFTATPDQTPFEDDLVNCEYTSNSKSKLSM
ncbi:hypothetical protein DFP72DRAFT_1074496 [Ephemerocybe angulata]|uniref:Uncharacterized protein n=1 Tax=Ephemerocybe angulata TaxID=980116 RepID=A0A8H6HK60_9AGAR|nr:hypothetical protein DFP72DRAFT_1074496 [Tulosesus angulatus]